MPIRKTLPSRLTPPLLLAALLLCGCAVQQPEPARRAAQVGPPATAPVPSPATSTTARKPVEMPPPLETHAVVVSPVSVSTAPATAIPQRPTNISVLAYGDKIRNMPAQELQQEIARLGDPADPNRQPADDLQLAIALGQTRVPADLVRAQALLQRVLANNQEEVRQLHPLARLLGARYAEQKRVEDQLDRQNQQLRDSQRRIDQLNERLEAMRAIERSLTSRTPGAAASSGGLRPPPP